MTKVNKSNDGIIGPEPTALKPTSTPKKVVKKKGFQPTTKTKKTKTNG